MPAIEPDRRVEDALFTDGYAFLIAVDEVGRGALCGPVACGAALFLPDLGDAPAGVRDSKLLSEKRRTALAPQLAEWLPAHAVGYATATEIETAGITTGLGLAAMRAIADVTASGALPAGRGVVLLDGTVDWLTRAGCSLPVVVRAKADRDCLSVAAASVLAKVARDQVMADLDATHPEYGLAGHKGYGASAHYAAIAAHGLIPGQHRASWIKQA